MLKRVLAGTAVAAMSLMSAATSAQAQATTAPPGTPASHAAEVDLHHAYVAHLGHTKAAKLAIMYARGHKSKSAKPATSVPSPTAIAVSGEMGDTPGSTMKLPPPM